MLRTLTGGRMSQMSLLENNCMQSTASAAGYSTGGTVGSAFAALYLVEGHHQPWWVVTGMVFLTAALGVFLAIPMKRQMINQEQLPFPSGIAAAETLRSLYSEGREAMRKAHALILGIAVGGVFGILKNLGTVAETFATNGSGNPRRSSTGSCPSRICCRFRIKLLPNDVADHRLRLRTRRADDRRGHDHRPADGALDVVRLGDPLPGARAGPGEP